MRALFTQALRFFGLSGIGWLLDFSVYSILGLFSDNLTLNNMISSWTGVSFVFIAASGRVFENRGRLSLRWKYLLYLAYQCVLIYFISHLLNRINGALIAGTDFWLIQKFSNLIAKCLITPVTMTLNFLVMKKLIERL